MLILYICAIWLCVNSSVAEAVRDTDQETGKNERFEDGLQPPHISTRLYERDSGILQVSLSSDGG